MHYVTVNQKRQNLIFVSVFIEKNTNADTCKNG